MKKSITLFLLVIVLHTYAQIGGGWDWAFNSGSLGGANIKHMKYTADGSKILFGGEVLGAAYFNGITYAAPRFGNYPGNIKFLGKINTATGVPTILKSYINILMTFQCITTDDAGNFYIGGVSSSEDPIDFGNGVTATGLNKVVVVKFDATASAVWAKTFPFGAPGAIGLELSKLAVSKAGNIFFWASNKNSDTNGKQNYPLYKLDNNGNVLWYKDALNTAYSVDITYGEQSTDKFIDDAENVQLFVQTTDGFTFDGVDHPGAKSPLGPSTLITINAAGTITKAKSFEGTVIDYQVNRTTGNIVFAWSQITPQIEIFPNLPHPKATLIPMYPKVFGGMIETDKDFNFIRAKDISSTVDNPFAISTNNLVFLALPNGKLLYLLAFDGTKSIGTDYNYSDANNKKANAIVETNTNWELTRFITGGKSTSVTPIIMAANGETYAMVSSFYAATEEALPITSYGSVTLTGFNAAADFNTYANYSVYKGDKAIVQTKSTNFNTANHDVLVKSLQVFPNPSTNVFHVEALHNINTITVFNVAGQQIQIINSLSPQVQLDLSNNNSGIYCLKIKLENGLTITKTVMKK